MVTIEAYQKIKFKIPKIATGPREIPLSPPFSKGEILSPPFTQGRAGWIFGLCALRYALCALAYAFTRHRGPCGVSSTMIPASINLSRI
jgi:hypothetical protein